MVDESQAATRSRFERWFEVEVIQPMTDSRIGSRGRGGLSRSCWGRSSRARRGRRRDDGSGIPRHDHRGAAVVAPGMMVMAIILFMGKVSGAHLNPAVTLAFSLRGDFPWRRVPGYIVVQLAGAAFAAWFLDLVIGESATYGSNYPADGWSDWWRSPWRSCSRSGWSASSSVRRRARRTSASSARSAWAPTSPSPGYGAARSRGPR